jgi:chemotaxis protein MotB
MSSNINQLQTILILLFLGISMSACVSKSQFDSMKTEYDSSLSAKDAALINCQSQLATSEQKNNSLTGELAILNTNVKVREEQLATYRTQVEDLKKQRDQQREQLANLTDLSKSTSNNITQSLDQLKRKDAYIRSLQTAKSRIDSMNFVLTTQLNNVLSETAKSGDAIVTLEKTQIKIMLSDRLLYQVGSTSLTDRGKAALDTIADVMKLYPEWTLLVEGHSDNIKMTSTCIVDNWDVSSRRAASIARSLVADHGVNPTRIISGARSEFMPLEDNMTPEGRAVNRRINITLLPPPNRVYDLLRADRVPN